MFMRRQDFRHTPIFSFDAKILGMRQNFHGTPIFYVFANVLVRRRYSMILLDFIAANICVYFQYLFMHLSMRQYFWRDCFSLRFKINVVVTSNDYMKYFNYY
jgi:hypothetical protein